MIPDKRESLDLHKKAGSNDRIVRHCKMVALVSKIIASQLGEIGVSVDERSIFAAALLHDIGRNKTNTISHGLLGANLVRDLGVDESVARIIRRHVGAGITEDEAIKNGLPAGDYVPETIEDKVVCYADKLVSSDALSPFEREVEKFRKRGLDVERLKALSDSICGLLGEDPEILVESRIGKEKETLFNEF